MDATLAQLLESHQNLVAVIVRERKAKAELEEECEALRARLNELEAPPVPLHPPAEEAS